MLRFSAGVHNEGRTCRSQGRPLQAAPSLRRDAAAYSSRLLRGTLRPPSVSRDSGEPRHVCPPWVGSQPTARLSRQLRPSAGILVTGDRRATARRTRHGSADPVLTRLRGAGLAGITSLGSTYLSLTGGARKSTLMLLGLSKEPAIGGAHGGVLLTVMGRDVVIRAEVTSFHDLQTQARRLVAFTLLRTCAERFLVD